MSIKSAPRPVCLFGFPDFFRIAKPRLALLDRRFTLSLSLFRFLEGKNGNDFFSIDEKRPVPPGKCQAIYLSATQDYKSRERENSMIFKRVLKKIIYI